MEMFISKEKYEKLKNETSDLREELRKYESTIRFLALHKKMNVFVFTEIFLTFLYMVFKLLGVAE